MYMRHQFWLKHNPENIHQDFLTAFPAQTPHYSLTLSPIMASIQDDLPETDTIASAIRFVNSTASHIFLTGKAGTGKTTFLKNLARRTHKQFVVVAPTGIAALNAGGVTIHSQFLFPFGMFLPDRQVASELSDGAVYTSDTLARRHPLNSLRKQVLRSIDMLVIDEVSMLRADLLDALDYRLKAARGNFRQSFGGVQLLMIGDLYQLPPVVKREDEERLRRYYPSPWFFEARALQHDGFVYIELDKIFRQRDDGFIRILNNLRNNQPTAEDVAELNTHYKPPQEIQHLKEVITLTTHNYKADELNHKALQAIDSPLCVMEATVKGDFPESMYPVLHRLELKKGAQIMFTKNDNEGKAYFNGRLAMVTSIEGTTVEVSMAETHEAYVLKKEIWENKRYTVNAATQDLDDEVIGTFEQYPVKLAWAITIHKSQGLTFDRAIIDVGQAFADGQVYVALSRLRSLDGLILRTHIDPAVVSTDKKIVVFTTNNHHPEELQEQMKAKQIEYIHLVIIRTFDVDELIKEIAYIQKTGSHSEDLDNASMKPVLEQIKNMLLSESENTIKFKKQLTSLLENRDQAQLIERTQKGTVYFKTVLQSAIKLLLRHLEEMKKLKRVKTYVGHLSDLDQLFAKKLEAIDKAMLLIKGILEGRDDFDFSRLTEERTLERAKMLDEIRAQIGATPIRERKSRSKRAPKGETQKLTLKLLESGLNAEGIAKERGLAISTIESHLAKAVEDGHIQVFQFVSETNVAIITDVLMKMPEGFSSKDLFAKLGGKYTFGQLRAVMSHTGIKSVRHSDA